MLAVQLQTTPKISDEGNQTSRTNAEHGFRLIRLVHLLTDIAQVDLHEVVRTVFGK